MTLNRKCIFSLLLGSFVQLAFASSSKVLAATSTVELLTAGNFAVLAGQHVTSVPIDSIIGNVGLSPAAGSFITGLTAVEVNGTIYAVDTSGPAGSVSDPGMLTIAKNDLTSAYLDAAGRTPSTVLIGGDNQLGGQTLTTGVYSLSHATTANLTAANPLILDGQGDPSAVFIFQASSDLVTASGSVVQLTNGAQACNVFWQVTSSAILGTGSTFVGTIMALTDITDNGGSTINGRLLARNNDVILNDSTVNVTACANGTTTIASSQSSLNTNPGAAQIPACIEVVSNENTIPTILSSSRLGPTSVQLSWGPYAGTDSFNVRYGFERDNLTYNFDVTGFVTSINDLPANHPIWVSVATRNYCSIGRFSESELVGGPKLPRAGMAPRNNHAIWPVAERFYLWMKQIKMYLIIN